MAARRVRRTAALARRGHTAARRLPRSTDACARARWERSGGYRAGSSRGFSGTHADRCGGRLDPVLGFDAADRSSALNANAYAFMLPPCAVELAERSRWGTAFRAGEQAWAVQFHPEVRRDQVLGLVRGGRSRSAKAAQRARERGRRGAGRVARARPAPLPRVPDGCRTGYLTLRYSSGRSSCRDHSCHEPR